MSNKIEMTYTANPCEAKQFASKKSAVQAAISIRLTRNNVCPIEIMGYRMWAICDRPSRMLTNTGFSVLLSAIQAEYARSGWYK